MTANSLQFNKFEMKSNVDGKTVDLRAGASIIQYRESVFMPHVEITAFINDTGNTVPADDGSGAGVVDCLQCTTGRFRALLAKPKSYLRWLFPGSLF